MKTLYIRNLKIIIAFSLIFFSLILCNYLVNLRLLHGTIADQQSDTIKAASKRISKWFQQKIDSTEAVRDFLIDFEHEYEKDEVKKLLVRSTQVANFRNVYVGYDDNTIISGAKWDKPRNYVTTLRPWYINTLSREKVVVTAPYIDIGLKEVVVSICAPLKESYSQKKGVVCGILPLEKIKEEILDISLPYDGVAFIINYYGKIILHPDSQKHLTISPFKSFDNNKYTIVDKEQEEHIFSQDRIKYSNWYIVAQLKKSSVYEKINLQLFINLAIYAVSLFVFFLLNLFFYRNQKSSDENLIKTKAILRHFVDHGDSGILIADNENKIIFENSLFRDLFHLDSRENKILDENTDIFDVLPKKIKSKLLEIIDKTKNENKGGEITFILEKNEFEKHFLFEVLPVLSRQGIYQGFIIFYKDVTLKEKAKKHKREQEDILFQQSKMADLGEMIAAVSHQWRQPLNSLSIMIGNLLQFKQMNRLTDDIFEENLNNSLCNIHYLADTIDTFRNFYKPNKKWQTFDIDTAIEEVYEVLSPQFKTSGIKLNLRKGEYKTCDCLNYKNEFQQIVANLLQNAKDAILENKDSKKEIDISIRLKKSTYYIEISDFGAGIVPEMKTKMFQSFQTTKKENGTGKGLYLSRLIARKKLKGNLALINFAKPTTFLITLPCNETEDNNA